jgi:uncharacterized BrkB/YihY/UPF0761 family membrane protein
MASIIRNFPIIGVILSILILACVLIFSLCDNTILRWIAYGIAALSAIINFILVQLYGNYLERNNTSDNDKE